MFICICSLINLLFVLCLCNSKFFPYVEFLIGFFYIYKRKQECTEFYSVVITMYLKHISNITIYLQKYVTHSMIQLNLITLFLTDSNLII